MKIIIAVALVATIAGLSIGYKVFGGNKFKQMIGEKFLEMNELIENGHKEQTDES